MTSLAERVPLDRIEQRARQARPGRAVLTVIAAVLFGLGWLACKAFALACKAFALAWLAVAWCGSALIEGWQAARTAQRAP